MYFHEEISAKWTRFHCGFVTIILNGGLNFGRRRGIPFTDAGRSALGQGFSVAYRFSLSACSRLLEI
jgi:hypothetical protein